MLRILHVNKFLHRRGGAEAYMLDLAEAQRTRGDQVAFFAMAHPDNEPDPFERWFPGQVELNPPPSGLGPKAAAVGRMLWSSSARRGVRAVAEQVRPDVAHLHNVYQHLSPSVVAGLADAGVPMVMTVHDYKLICPSYQLLAAGAPCEACVTGSALHALRRRCKDGSVAASGALAVEAVVHRRLGAWDDVPVLICPSRFLAGRMVAGGIDPDRLVVVPHPAVAVEPVRPLTPDGARRPIVLFGRLSAEKGVDVAVRAVAGAEADVRLEVAGDGPMRSALAALAEEVAPGRVRFHGRLRRAEVHQLVAGAAAVVVPSRWYENQPMTVLEAFALGRPVIGSDLGGTPELVLDGDTGWLVPADDPVALARAMAAAVTDPAEADRRGGAARRFVERRHGLAAHLEAVDAAYELARARSVAAGGGPARRPAAT